MVHQRSHFLAEREAALEARARQVAACGDGGTAADSNVLTANFAARRTAAA
jgi:hypothetical protein